MNCLGRYCKFGTSEYLQDDSIGALIQGLWIVYECHGNCRTWTVDEDTKKAKRNPLTGNIDIVAIHRAHRVHLARQGNMSPKAWHLMVAIIYDHCKHFSFGQTWSSSIDARDVQLDDILVLGIHLGLRYDEVGKLQVKKFSVTSCQETITLRQSMKNSTVQQDYSLKEWSGNIPLQNCLFMDP